MSINTYTGLQGSGKSFEVVKEVILPAILIGRNVVTNISGCNYDLIVAYLVKNNKDADPSKFGKLTTCENEDVIKDDFFPSDTGVGNDANSVVKGGDLVCIDECWNFWSSNHKLSAAAEAFFRMHRHYTHPVTKVSCDVALMIQDIPSLNRKLKALTQMISVCTKLKALGMPTRYRVDLYEGSTIRKALKLKTFVKKYDPEIFPLYKSYAAGTGVEKNLDKRINVFTDKRLWLGIIFLVAMLGTAFFYVWKFFHPVPPPSTKVVVPLPGTASASIVSGAAPRTATEGFSSSWRVTGRFQRNGVTWVVLSDSAGRLRIESPSAVVGLGLEALGTVDGQRVTPYSGAALSYQSNVSQSK